MSQRSASEWLSAQVAAFCAAIGSFLMPVRPLMIAVAILIALDFVTGVAASLRKREPITSRRGFDSAIKILVYQSCVVTGMILEIHLFGGQVPAAKMVGTVIVAIEAKSILENGERIAGTPIFKALRERLRTRGGDDK